MYWLKSFLTLVLITLVTSTSSANPAPAVITHDNQHPAGTLKDGTLVLTLRAAAGIWHPEGAQGPGLSIDAFAEGDGSLMAPAPLIRVPEGTTIAATITNTLSADLQVHGLCEHTDAAPTACATINVPAMATRKVQFPAGRAGTYVWWASTAGVPLQVRYGRDTQLSGAFIVDPPGGPTEADRIFVVTEWTSLTHEQLAQAFKSDDPFATAISMRPKFATFINARSWPNTERLTYRVGDLAKWRIVNASPESHPMHLHGFYFYVDSLGDGMVDRPFSRDRKPHVVTQLVPSGTTMSLTWMPERAGNWLFHCHIMEHVAPERALGQQEQQGQQGQQGHQHHDAAGMAGMVMGIQVLERPQTVSGDGPGPDATDWCPVDGVEPSVRKLTLTMRNEDKKYGFVLTDGIAKETQAPPATPLAVPGPTLVLRRDQPVEIALVNQLPEATAVHWHGMELDSYYDGVHGFSGLGGQTTPMIEPGATFTVKFTPPRTGTFIYHTHVHDERQLTAGLYGALLVVEPGAAAAFDPDTDHPLVIGRDGIGPAPTMVLNGSPKPQFSWRAGVKHRLRLVNITRHDIVSVTLMTAAGPVLWRPLTKDGAPAPAADSAPRTATQKIAVGETYDFEYEAPAMRQSLWIEIRDEAGDWRVQGHAVLK